MSLGVGIASSRTAAPGNGGISVRPSVIARSSFLRRSNLTPPRTQTLRKPPPTIHA